MKFTNLDFVTLNKASGNEAWNDTFAYWLLVLHDASSLYAQDADEAQSVMAYQYDVEEQGNLDGEGPEGSLVPTIFAPIAPVTLALLWSPFSAAIEALGQPLHFDAKGGDTLAVFTPQVLPESFGLTSDERHFSFLLHHACARALNEKALVLLVGSPGWAYDSEDFLEKEPEVRKQMEDAGFVYTLRKPENA
jgi:hypothetical protein